MKNGFHAWFSTITSALALLVALLGTVGRDRIVEWAVDKAVYAHSQRITSDFALSPENVGLRWEYVDAEAGSILRGERPSERSVAGEVWRAGKILYVADSAWLEQAFPEGGRTRDDDEECLTKKQAGLEVMGFSDSLNAVLFRYTAPGPSGGTPCDTGDYVFYPL